MGDRWIDDLARRLAGGAKPDRAPAPEPRPEPEVEEPRDPSRRKLLSRAGILGAAVATYVIPGWTPALAACRRGLTKCAGRCVNLRTSERHCGRCGHRCRANQYCSKGKCCRKGLTNCRGRCTNLKTSEQHCGKCGNTCASGKYCSKGKCCPEGTVNCGGTCRDLKTSEDHCGTCGHACASGETCVAGVCSETEPTACTTAAQCDDGNPCTTDACSDGVCTHSPVAAGTSCDDGLFCTGASTCDAAGICQPGASPCDDGGDCTIDACNEATQSCNYTPDNAMCDDGNPCTTDVCSEGVCMNSPVADGTACEGGACQGGTCVAGGTVCEPGSTAPCYTGPGGSNVGVCRPGTTTCLEDGSGYGACIGEVTPTPEVCNGLDDDCDGNVDNGFDVGAACSNGQLGACEQTGTTVCSPDGTSVVCNVSSPPVTPTAEVCNGIDDDCDGIIDNGDNSDELCPDDPGTCRAGVCNGADGCILVSTCSGAEHCCGQPQGCTTEPCF